MRGGGSLESMLAFNNELLVRQIVGFPVPVIAAIGHHKDVPLLSLAADLAVSTPSMAAISLCRSWEQAASLLKEQELSILDTYSYSLERVSSLLDWQRVVNGFNGLLTSVKQQLKHCQEIVHLRNPQTQLRLGYSLVSSQGRLIRSVKDTKIGEDLDIAVKDGEISSKVKRIKKHGQR